MQHFTPAVFDEHAQAIAKRQYMQPGDGDVCGMFRRVAAWVASAEKSEQDKQYWAEQFYQLMASKRFCPGGRVLAGAGTQHGNVLNCFVQGATEHDPSSFDGVMEVATKLALVTKVGGGNGVNLDPYVSRKQAGPRRTVRGFAYISAEHPDVEDFIQGLMRPPINPDGEKEPITVRNWTRVVYGLLKPELAALARRHGVLSVREKPSDVLPVPDDMRGIVEAAKAALALAIKGQEPHVDFSSLRPEGAPIKGSGGTSSGPVSFLVEIFDNFLEWANLGAEKSGPVATLRYVYAPVLRVVRQGGTRRGAGMATLAIDHPDLLDFLTAKDLDREASEGDISTFNISILVSDAFWSALQADGLWPLEPTEVPGKYYPYPLPGTYQGVLPDLPERPQDGARPIPLYQGKVPARWLWHEIAWHAWATGEPGLIFIDRVNQLSALKNLGKQYEIRSTNPCFVGGTRIATEFGLLPIEQLTDKGSFYLVTDNRAPLGGVGAARLGRGVTVRKAAKAFYTGEREVVRLETREGLTLTLTPNHPLLTPQGYVEAGQLKPGDKLLVQSGEGLWAKEQALPPAVLKVVRERVAVAGGKGTRGRFDVREQYAHMPTQWSENLGLVLGWLIGDGYLREDGVGFFFNNRELAQAQIVVDSLRDWFGQGTLQATTSNTHHLHFNKLPAEFFTALGVKSVRASEKRVPESLFTAPREAVVGFLRGLFSTDGTVERNDAKRSCTVQLASSSLGLLQDVQLLLLNFGIFGRIYHRREAGLKALPDGRGGLREYPVAEQYELIIGAESRDRFAEVIGFALPEKQAKLEEFIGSRSRGAYRQRFEVTVSRVEPAGVAPVYDLTEPVTHSLIAGGVVAHNCGEIPLTVGEPCDLGALNLAAYVENGQFNFEAFRRDVRTAVRFLDDVLDVNVFALEDNRQASQTLRRLGLGVMGLADMLIKMGLPYSSEAARQVVAEVMGVLRQEAIAASEQLGQERGVFPLYQQRPEAFEALGIRPRRNVAVLTVAPTGTTSMLMGVSSGIEPVYSPFMWRRIGGQYKALLHPLFVEMMQQYPPSGRFEKNGAWDWEAIIEAIQANHGSLKGLEGIPPAIANVFEGAHDVPPLDHVRMQGVVQTAFDAEGYAANSLSKTINLPNQATVEDVEAAYTEAFRTGCKGITVYRDGSREFQVLSVSKEKKENKSEETVVQPALLEVPPSQDAPTARPVFERTGRLVGYTDMVKLTNSDGTRRSFLVTVNMQGDYPIEVILTSGKAGDEANADSEALGRVISIALQYGVPAEALVKTLRGINGGLYGSYQGRFVTSKADLIAVALETTSKVQASQTEPQAPVVPQAMQRAMTAPLRPSTGLGRCPECGEESLAREEGCLKCYSCGYSKCG
ncbi:intein-containing adenosylcobalamin-dependent ribonucleoside-diphosphate reductase [Meiothermus rufus]|uniref:intein-containing adenosylcobalamin-dependent ribonucleoside-diphosphate reductase n=1 Tax=Meiothermus rufus TaxID=604332 RepID=UPI00048919E1|nr:intein-containing adenosylcobalamin-dependent ribonucleoside-diphosphate reductase [Meiothermus rufus]